MLAALGSTVPGFGVYTCAKVKVSNVRKGAAHAEAGCNGRALGLRSCRWRTHGPPPLPRPHHLLARVRPLVKVG